MAEIAAPKGTRDILPAEQASWQWVLQTHARVAESFGYRAIETPVYEATELFARAVGGETDIVEKQMFTFDDRGGRSLSLRPEGTAGAVRAVVGARLDQEQRPVRVHYAGPMFRAERPQAGRQHQFTQLGIECIGDRSPAYDAEIVEVGVTFLHELGVTGVHLQLNSLGSSDERAQYRNLLIAYYTPFEQRLCDDCKRRLHTNPLRLLDCKRDADLVEKAPVLYDSLGEESRAHFAAVCAQLDDAGITYAVNHRIVRGLDYYSDTVFELWHENLHGAQNALGGGGRYDGLAELLGLPSTPGTGYALGVERIHIVAQQLEVAPEPQSACDVVVCSVDPAQGQETLRLARELRAAGARTISDVAARKLDRKLRAAAKLGARAAVIIGEDEIRDREIVLRDLREHVQERVPRASLSLVVTRLIGVQ